MRIREANFEDIDTIVALGRLMHVESDFAPIPFDDLVCQKFMEHIVADDNSLAAVADVDGRIVGGVFALCSPFFFSSALQTTDVSVYVVPEFRGGSAAIKLLKAYEAWAVKKGAARIYLGVTTGDTKAGQVYAKMGYELVGGIYRKDTRTVS